MVYPPKMTAKRRNTVRNPRCTRLARTNQRLTQVRNDLKGQRLRLSPDPPSFTQIPWHPIVLSDNITFIVTANTKNYTASSISNIFKAQTGCKQPNDELSFRLLRVSVWELSGKKVTLEVLDLTVGLGANDFLAQLEDIPGRNQWARVGYSYPASQNLVIFSGNDTETLVTVTADNGSTICVRFHVLWRFRFGTLPNRTISLPTSVQQRLSMLEQQLRELRIKESTHADVPQSLPVPTTGSGSSKIE